MFIAPSFSVGRLVPFFAELSRVCVVSLFMIFMCLSGSFNCLVGNVDVFTFINILKGPRLLQQLLSLH